MAGIWATLPGTPLLLPATKKKKKDHSIGEPPAGREGVVGVPVSPFPFPRGPSAKATHMEVPGTPRPCPRRQSKAHGQRTHQPALLERQRRAVGLTTREPD